MNPVQFFHNARFIGFNEQSAENVYKTLGIYFVLTAPEDVFQPRSNVISVMGRNLCEEFILLFGRFITFLRIDYDLASNVRNFNGLLAHHCAASLHVFSITGTPNRPLEFDSDRQFKNVYTLKIDNSNLADSLMSISQSFPEVIELSLFHVTSTNFRVRFNKMKKLNLGSRFQIGLYEPFLSRNIGLTAITITTEVIIPLSDILTVLEGNRPIQLLIVTATFGSEDVTYQMVTELMEQHYMLHDLRLENYIFNQGNIQRVQSMRELNVFYCMADSYMTKLTLQQISNEALELRTADNRIPVWRNLFEADDTEDLAMRLTRLEAH